MDTSTADILDQAKPHFQDTELASLGLFNGVDMDGIEGHLEHCHTLELPAGEALIRANQPVDNLFLLISGRLNVHQPPKMDEPNSTVEPGECFGETLLFSQKPCNLDVIASEDSRVLAIKEETLVGIINSSEAFSHNFLFLLIQNMRGAEAVAQERKKLQEKYQRHSNTDDLTGLHNRRWLDDMLTRQIMRSSQDNEPLTVLMVDIDKFEEFKKEFGETATDQALYTIGQVILESSRPTDLPARFEQDRFVIVLPGTDAEGAWNVAERLHAAVETKEIEIPGECILPPITASIGIVQKESFVAASKLISLALSATKRAKERGGNQISE